MRLFKTNKLLTEKEEKTRAQIRAERLDTPSLYAWMDNCVMSLGASFDSWRYKNAPSDEVTSCIEAIHVVWSEIEKRKSERNR